MIDFYLSQFGDDDSDASSADLDSLPYPKPLARSAFLAPDFDPTTFLSSLNNRFQTLEDLRSELRQRSQDLNKELLDLVNSNYEDFLGLGRDLQGGDEKIEEVRLGVLGFKREVEGLRDNIREQRLEIEQVTERQRKIREQVILGRELLEVDRRIGQLEERLMLVQNGVKEDGVDELESDAESEDDVEEVIAASKIRRRAEEYVYITRLVNKLGPELPFLVAQEERVLRLKQTILLDLSNALKQIYAMRNDQRGSVMRILDVYKTLGEQGEAVKTLKEAKRRKI